MKRLIAIRVSAFGAFALVSLLGLAAVARAQSTTTTGSLTVTMTVQSSISLVFVQSPQVGTTENCSLSGANTSSAALNLGIATTAGDNESCVSFAATGNGSTAGYSLTDLIYYQVTKSNSSSNSYSLTATLPSTPVSGVTWSINSTNLSASPISVTANGAYSNSQYFTLKVNVLATVTTNNLSQTIDFTATAN